MSRNNSKGAAQRAAKQCCIPTSSTDTRPRRRRSRHHAEQAPTIQFSNEQLRVKRTGTVLVATRIQKEDEKPSVYDASRHLAAFTHGARLPQTLSTDNVARSGSLGLERSGTPRHRRR